MSVPSFLCPFPTVSYLCVSWLSSPIVSWFPPDCAVSHLSDLYFLCLSISFRLSSVSLLLSFYLLSRCFSMLSCCFSSPFYFTFPLSFLSISSLCPSFLFFNQFLSSLLPFSSFISLCFSFFALLPLTAVNGLMAFQNPWVRCRFVKRDRSIWGKQKNKGKTIQHFGINWVVKKPNSQRLGTSHIFRRLLALVIYRKRGETLLSVLKLKVSYFLSWGGGWGYSNTRVCSKLRTLQAVFWGFG